MKKAIIFSILLIASAFLSGCNESNNQKAEDNSFTVYTTVYPLQYFTERIAGDSVTVKTIYPPGADEHTFEPSQRDMMSLADSDVFFYIGLGLEGFVEKAKSTLKSEDVKFIALGESVEEHIDGNNHDEHSTQKEGHEEEHGAEHEGESHEEEHGAEHEGESHEEEHNHGDIDPHLWLDPIYAKQMALTIKDTLNAEMPEKKEVFEENFHQLEKELDELHSSFQTTIDSAKRKEIIVSHAAFGYWEKRYGIQQISISGLSTASEPTQKELEKIVEIAKEKDLNYILFEQNVSSKLAEIIQQEIKAKSLTLHNLSTLTDENLKNNETYFTLMKKNITSLSTALNE